MASLQVRPIEAKIKKDTDTFGKMDPYVVCIVGQEKHQTQKSKGVNPKWTETLTFTQGAAEMMVEVWDKDRFSSDDFVGRAKVDLSPFINHGKKHDKVELNLEDKGEIAGVLYLELEFEGVKSPWTNPNSGWDSEFGKQAPKW